MMVVTVITIEFQPKGIHRQNDRGIIIVSCIPCTNIKARKKLSYSILLLK